MIFLQIFSVFALVYISNAQNNPTNKDVSPTSFMVVTQSVPVITSMVKLSIKLHNDTSIIVATSTISPDVSTMQPPSLPHKNSSTTPIPSLTSTFQSMNATSTHASSHSTVHQSSSTTLIPSVTQTPSPASHTSTIVPSVVSSHSLTMSASIQPSGTITHSSATVVASSTIVPTTIPSTTAKARIECGKECQTLRKRLYASATFAVLFLLIAIMLGILLYRQYKISSDYQNDPMLSRLI